MNPILVHVGGGFARGALAYVVGGAASYFLPNLLLRDRTFARFALSVQIRREARSRPRLAEKLLWFLLPPATADGAIDDLNTRFDHRKALYKTSWARSWYWLQFVRLLFPVLEKLIAFAVKWGVFEWVRRRLF